MRNSIKKYKSVCGLTFAAIMGGLAPALAGPVEARYHISIAGLHIGTATITGQISVQSYRATLNAQLIGLAGALTSGRGAVNVSGSFQGDRPLSAGYALTANNSTISRTIQIGMAGGNVSQVAIEPPFEIKPDRVPVLEHHRRNVADPVSALLMPVAGQGELLEASSCERMIQVFDGVQRFNVQLSSAGTKDINEPRKGYVGQAVVCAARYMPVAGHRPIPSTSYMADNRDISVWLVPVAGSRTLMPWRIQVRTQLGNVVIEAQSISGLAIGGAAQDATSSIKR
jgi:Protein of unknown function (DUF3108)